MTESSVYPESETIDSKKPAKEVLVVHDEGFFQHDTGDTYNGSYEVKKKDKSVKMHGFGEYSTAEGDKYTGIWDGDKLGISEEAIITFTDGSQYQGLLKDGCYSGYGKYRYFDGSTLTCSFVENSPVGNLTLLDPNEHIWQGKAERGFCWFEPVNHFYDILESTKEFRGKHRHDNKAETSEIAAKEVRVKSPKRK